MKAMSMAVALCLGLAWTVAGASVVSTLGSTAPITEDSVAGLDAVILVDAVPGGYASERITGLQYSFDSGDGQISSGMLSGLDSSSIDLLALFNYASPGTFLASFTATVATRDAAQRWVDTSYWQTNSYWVSSGYSVCDFSFFGWCMSSHWVDTSHWAYYQTYVSQGYYTTDFVELNYAVGAQVPVEVLAADGHGTDVPEPASVLLVAGGLAGLGFLRMKKGRRAG